MSYTDTLIKNVEDDLAKLDGDLNLLENHVEEIEDYSKKAVVKDNISKVRGFLNSFKNKAQTQYNQLKPYGEIAYNKVKSKATQYYNDIGNSNLFNRIKDKVSPYNSYHDIPNPRTPKVNEYENAGDELNSKYNAYYQEHPEEKKKRWW